MSEIKINHAAAVVCILVLHAIGFLWYSPILFAEPWMAMVGWTEEKMQANPPGASIWIVNFLTCTVSVYALAWLFTKLNVIDGLRGAGLALAFAISFNFLSVLNGAMFAGDPMALAFITAGFTLVGMSVSGFILGAWVKR